MIIDPLLVTIILSATSLGIVMPVLKDAGQRDPARHARDRGLLGRGVRRDRAAVDVLLRRTGSPHPLQTVGKLVVLGLAVPCIAIVAARAGRWDRLHDVIGPAAGHERADPDPHRGLALLALLVLSQELKFDAILGAFMAGALLSALTDPRRATRSSVGFRHKLDAIGFGFFIPVFFVVDRDRASRWTQLFADTSACCGSRSSSC